MGWNRELKKFTAALAALLAAGLLAVNIGAGMYGNYVRRESIRVLTSFFGNLAAAYPDVKEEELIRLLNQKGNEERGAEILAGYGVFQEYGSDSFAVQEKQLLFLCAGANVLALLLFSGVCGVVFLYLRKRYRKIISLENYMKELNREGYRLDIEDNSDDELSSLRNEIYKLTVLLKEQAGNALTQKCALADSVTNISHQLKTPLTSALVLIDNLSDNPDMDQITRRHFLSEITGQITGMSWLITAMMKLARLDAGVVEMQESRFGLRAFVEEVLRRLETAAELRQVTFAVDVPEEARLSADRRWTAEALMNIVKNAVEHSPEGGCVEVSGEENDIYAQIVVRDHGEGITKEEQEKLFKRFYNGNSTREDSTGIGLALAREIVEKQEGFIYVDAWEGKGTRFILRFLKK